MNAPDQFAEFFAAFPDLMRAFVQLTDADKDALADEYQREQIATAQSEATQQAIARSYAK